MMPDQTGEGRGVPVLSRVGLNLGAIERSLRAFQADIERINAVLGSRLEPVEDGVIRNMVAGYAEVDRWVAEGVDLLAPGSSPHLLDLNAVVLCGRDPAARVGHEGHLAATRDHFYDQRGGGIGALVEWYKRNRGQNVWLRAAGMFLEIVREPQLFVEGNHRTAVLMINYLLLREGRPPFVLTPDNALPFFTLTVGARRGLTARLSSILAAGGGGVRGELAHFLSDHAREGERFRRE